MVHRDLKPANLALTPDGLLKILDFGLARLVQPRPTSPGHTTATETAGVVAGSPPYMAPEQLLGKPPDVRTDLYSVGVVLYELATGRRPFGTRSGVALTDAILHELPPAPRSTIPSRSPGLEALLLKALDKDPELRYQTAKDLLVDLERLQVRSTSGSATSAALPAALSRGRHRWTLGAPALVCLLAAGTWLVRPQPPPRITSTHALATLGRSHDVDRLHYVRPTTFGVQAVSDGENLYFVAARGDRSIVYRLPAASGDPVEVPHPFAGTVFLFGWMGSPPALLMAGSLEGLSASDADDGWPLWRVPLPAGAPQRLGNLVGSSAEVSPDARQIAFSRGRSILVASTESWKEREVHRHPAGEVSGVRWSPDGRSLRLSAIDPEKTPRVWLWEVPAHGGPARALWPGYGGRWTPDGRRFVFTGLPSGEIFVTDESWPARWRRAAPATITSGALAYTVLGTSRGGTRLFVSAQPPRRVRAGDPDAVHPQDEAV